MAEKHRPWPLAAGVATAAAGLFLIILAVAGDGILSARDAAAAIVLAALLELATGALLTRDRGPGMAHVFSGLLALGLAVFTLVHGLYGQGVMGPGPLALAIGMYCIWNAIFRGIDVVIDRPQAQLGEAIDTAFTFVIGAVLLANWREATAAFVGVAAGLELISGGIALFASVLAHDRHRDEPAYDGRSDRLVRVPVGRRSA